MTRTNPTTGEPLSALNPNQFAMDLPGVPKHSWETAPDTVHYEFARVGDQQDRLLAYDMPPEDRTALQKGQVGKVPKSGARHIGVPNAELKWHSSAEAEGADFWDPPEESDWRGGYNGEVGWVGNKTGKPHIARHLWDIAHQVDVGQNAVPLHSVNRTPDGDRFAVNTDPPDELGNTKYTPRTQHDVDELERQMGMPSSDDSPLVDPEELQDRFENLADRNTDSVRALPDPTIHHPAAVLSAQQQVNPMQGTLFEPGDTSILRQAPIHSDSTLSLGYAPLNHDRRDVVHDFKPSRDLD